MYFTGMHSVGDWRDSWKDFKEHKEMFVQRRVQLFKISIADFLDFFRGLRFLLTQDILQKFTWPEKEETVSVLIKCVFGNSKGLSREKSSFH